MEILTERDPCPAPPDGTVVTIGAYDGVHLGHRAVIDEVRARAATQGCRSAVVTFDRHPAQVIRPDSAPLLLTDLDQKLELLAGTGIDYAMVVRFDPDRATETAEHFVETVLVDCLRARSVVVGEDFHFGHNRRGNVALLGEMGARLGFDVLGHKLVGPDGQAARDDAQVSSTAIRRALHEGRLVEANLMLGRPHEMRGVVVTGDQRGRTLGFPTANVACDNPLMPPDGIFVTTLVSERFGALPAITYIGQRPTFGDGPRTVETFVLNWRDERPLDLYAQIVRIDFHTFLRPDARYESAQLLMEQMARDVAAARAHFGLNA